MTLNSLRTSALLIMLATLSISIPARAQQDVNPDHHDEPVATAARPSFKEQAEADSSAVTGEQETAWHAIAKSACMLAVGTPAEIFRAHESMVDEPYR
jgi:hypothetical protein